MTSSLYQKMRHDSDGKGAGERGDCRRCTLAPWRAIIIGCAWKGLPNTCRRTCKWSDRCCWRLGCCSAIAHAKLNCGKRQSLMVVMEPWRTRQKRQLSWQSRLHQKMRPESDIKDRRGRDSASKQFYATCICLPRMRQPRQLCKELTKGWRMNTLRSSRHKRWSPIPANACHPNAWPTTGSARKAFGGMSKAIPAIWYARWRLVVMTSRPIEQALVEGAAGD